MSPFERLIQSLEATPSLEEALEVLLEELAQRVKATSNDQNVQKLAREIRIAAPGLAAAVAAKRQEAAS